METIGETVIPKCLSATGGFLPDIEQQGLSRSVVTAYKETAELLSGHPGSFCIPGPRLAAYDEDKLRKLAGTPAYEGLRLTGGV